MAPKSSTLAAPHHCARGSAFAGSNGLDALTVQTYSQWMNASPDDRSKFVAERRAASMQRFDTVHSLHYDENWGAISATQSEFVARLTALIRPEGEVLDAACGTGKHWPTLRAAGLHVTGVDQSAGMLDQARRKHPEVSTRVLALQDLAEADDLRGRFDGLLCIDALECVAPEDWPEVTAGLAGVLAPGGHAYITVVQQSRSPPPPSDLRQMPGEVIEGDGYYYCPPKTQVRDWLAAAGFAIDEQADADSYWHLLLSRAARK